MPYEVKFNIPERPLGKANISFVVKNENGTLSTLLISVGALVWFVLAVCLSASSLSSAARAGTLTDPGGFVSLGDFNPNASVVINMSTGQMTGGATLSGVSFAEEGFNMYVFSFDSFSLAPSYGISFVGTGSNYGVAFLSRGDMTIGGTIDGSASTQTPGPGGGGGGTNGKGSGLGGGDTTTGGGFGGNGGKGGGRSYGDLSVAMSGGSGGGGSGGAWSLDLPGGGGGGSIQLGTWANLNITGSVLARGGSGGGNFLVNRYSGGGSGGGILLYGMNVSVSGQINASGGNGVGGNQQTSGNPAGGGGGGRVYVATSTNGTFSNTGSIVVAGAIVRANYSATVDTSSDGKDGVVSVVSSDQVVVPEPNTIVMTLLGSLMLFFRPRRKD